MKKLWHGENRMAEAESDLDIGGKNYKTGSLSDSHLFRTIPVREIEIL